MPDSTQGRPLAGRTILLTRPGDPASIADPLRALGAEVVWIPVTRIETLDPAPLALALGRVRAFDRIVVSSANGARRVLELLGDRAVSALHGVTTCAVGPATARVLAAHGIQAVLMPDETFSAEGLVEAIVLSSPIPGSRTLFVTAVGARDEIPTSLRAQGGEVEVVEAYRSVTNEDRRDAVQAAMRGARMDLVIFTSASTVHAFVELSAGSHGARPAAASIGPQTTRAARAAGFTVVAEASPSTAEGLVRAIVEGLGGVR